jgi:beta-agarase
MVIFMTDYIIRLMKKEECVEMKKMMTMLGLCFLSSVWADGTDRAAFWYLSGKDAEVCRLENGTDPDDASGAVLKLSFRFRKGGKGVRALMLNLRKPLVLGSEHEQLSLFAHSSASGHRIYFECLDRDSETLLYSYTARSKLRTLDRKGWQEFRLTPSQDYADCWGGGAKANKRADFPLKVVRIWLDPAGAEEYSGTLLLKEMKVIRRGTDRAFRVEQAEISVLHGRAEIQRERDSAGAAFVLKISGDGFPGISFHPRNGFWDLSAYRALNVDVENLSGTEQVDCHLRIHSAGPDGVRDVRSVYSTIALNPREKRTAVLFLPHAEPGCRITFSVPLKGAPDGLDKAPNLFADRITRLSVYTQYPHRNTGSGTVHLRIGNIRPAIPYRKKLPERFFPFVDEFGQYIHDEWNGKVRSVSQLIARLEEEGRQLADSKRIASWNRFGGWAAGPRLEKSGFFRTAKYRGKWWLVDPEGCLFLSNGINAVQFFDDFAVKAPEWYRTPVKKGERMDFVRANLLKKYRGKLFPAVYERTHRRLENWGLNTIGGWSDPGLCKQRKTPYTVVLFDNGKAPKFGGLYDPFDPAFENALAENLNSEKFKWSINDPWCIGYFVNNELHFERHTAFAQAVAVSAPETPAKKAMETFLKTKYKTAERLNDAWGTAFRSWEDFRRNAAAPDRKRAGRDYRAFENHAAEEYFRVCRKTVKKYAPDQLYLGVRFNGNCHPDEPELFRIAARYCDVVSFNNYSNTVAQYMLADLPDVPLLIGEFALNVRDRGMFNDSLRTCGMTQQDRADGFLRYWQGVLVHPNLVGAHWFTWCDQPVTGRFDGENYQFGLVDCTDTPYEELTGAMRRVGEAMYGYRLTGTLTQPLK